MTKCILVWMPKQAKIRTARERKVLTQTKRKHPSKTQLHIPLKITWNIGMSKSWLRQRAHSIWERYIWKTKTMIFVLIIAKPPFLLPIREFWKQQRSNLPGTYHLSILLQLKRPEATVYKWRVLQIMFLESKMSFFLSSQLLALNTRCWILTTIGRILVTNLGLLAPHSSCSLSWVVTRSGGEENTPRERRSPSMWDCHTHQHSWALISGCLQFSLVQLQ